MSTLKTPNIQRVAFQLLLLIAVTIASASATDNATVARPQPFIIGGTPVAAGLHPSVVSVQTVAQQHFCGGVIINRQWLLSAAHCFIDSNRTVRQAAQVRVRSGSLRLGRGGRINAVRTIRLHPRYQSPVNRYNDIALLQIVGQFEWNQQTRAIAIDQRTALNGVAAVAVGWGRTDVSVI